MINRIKTRHAVLLLSIVTILAFQNCSSPSEDEASGNSVTSYEENLPFAFIPKPDVLSYMSCSRVPGGFEPRGYYSFRLGAYTSMSGMGLTTDFINGTKAFTPEERARAFSVSTATKNSFLQLSVRSTSDYQAALGPVQTGGAPTIRYGYELDSIVWPSEYFYRNMATVQPNQFKNYYPGPDEKRNMEGSVRYFEDETFAATTRTRLQQNQALLVAGFSDTLDTMSTDLRGPNGIKAKNVYGRGYRISFRTPSGFSSAEPRALANVNEIDLKDDSSTGSGWNCSNTYQFMVIRPADLASSPPRVQCYTGPDRYDPTDTLQLPRLQMIRRVLRAEDWYVDVKNRCIVPKNSYNASTDYCYGDRAGRPAINYTAAAGTCVGDACPHYVTVCVRQ